MNWRKFRPLSVEKLIKGDMWYIGKDANGALPIVKD